MRPQHGKRGIRFYAAFPAWLVVLLGVPAGAYAEPAVCTPGSCDDNNICTIDTCDPDQGCIYAPVDCDDGSVCTVDSCGQNGEPGPATIFLGHDTQSLEREYQKNGTFVQTWGSLPKATGAAVDASSILYICNPAYGNNIIERRGPGNANLGTITATVNGNWIEDMGNYTGGYILAGTIEGNVFRINTTNGSHILMFSTGQSFIGVTWDGTDIWTTGGYTNTLVARRDLAGNILATFDTGRINFGIGYDPDDGTLWIGHANGQVTHRSQAGALLGGFSTGLGGQLIDGVELAKMPLPDGCRNIPVSCDDSNFCTDDACNPMTGCFHPPHSCDDSDPCTDDSCDPQAGCVATNNTAPCENGDFCTTGDTCSNGQCLPGPPLVCNDNNVCTDDSCDSRTGCVFANNNNFCDDGNACTLEEQCVGGTCTGGFPVVCNDNNPCTADTCLPAQGCVYPPGPNGVTCDDGDPCTNGDVCVGGTCHGVPPVCVAPDPCHLAGVCDPLTGTCTNPNAPNGTTCNDGNPCTAGDVCVDGVCAGTPVGIPAESHNLTAIDKVTYSWAPASDATAYDAVRGVALPVGSSSTEACFHDLTTAKLEDATSPASASAFWYLARPKNPCGWGPWGAQSNGTARVTNACP